jgi:alanine dehydrogenase
MIDDVHLLNGLNVCRGNVTEEHVARALGYEYVEPLEALAAC